MNITMIVLGYTILCVGVAYYFARKGSGFSTMLLWAFCISPLGGIILGLMQIANAKLKKIDFSLKK